MFTDFSALNSPSLVMRVSFYLQIQGRHLSYERSISCFRGDRGEGWSVLLVPVVS